MKKFILSVLLCLAIVITAIKADSVIVWPEGNMSGTGAGGTYYFAPSYCNGDCPNSIPYDGACLPIIPIGGSPTTIAAQCYGVAVPGTGNVCPSAQCMELVVIDNNYVVVSTSCRCMIRVW
jgi:hypothetical protein